MDQLPEAPVTVTVEPFAEHAQTAVGGAGTGAHVQGAGRDGRRTAGRLGGLKLQKHAHQSRAPASRLALGYTACFSRSSVLFLLGEQIYPQYGSCV